MPPLPIRLFSGLLLILAACSRPDSDTKSVEEVLPNILFCIADDQSWIHTSVMGTSEVQTPNFDRVAREGVLFNNAYCAAPSCAASRAAILSGQAMWRLEEGGLLFGALPQKFPVFTQSLAEAGYTVGYTAKGYAPANHEIEGYWAEPLIEAHSDSTHAVPKGINPNDYGANFRQFLRDRSVDAPFFFWFGGTEPHRAYQPGIGRAHGINLDEVTVPGFLPNDSIVREDIADYYYEIEWFDRHLGEMLLALEESGQLENTIIIVTSDNGMPFPRAKANLYEYGTHMPLAIRWGAKVTPNRRVDDFISFTDFAPTLLEAAGLSVPEVMSGRSFLDVLLAKASGRITSDRNTVFTGIERHTYCRPGGLPYPIRAVRQGDWTYILNFEPDRWPAGHPRFDSPHQGFYGDIDTGPTMDFLLVHQDQPEGERYFALATAKRPRAELYRLSDDPFQLTNLAEDERYRAKKDSLHTVLIRHLEETGDPRARGEAPWDDYPYYFSDFAERAQLPVNERDTVVDEIIR